MQYIEQQNELIKVLQERIKNYEEADDDGISKEREVSEQAVSFLALKDHHCV